MNQSLASFYQNKVSFYVNEIAKVKKQLSISSSIRLAVFVVLAFLIYFLFGAIKLILITIILGIVIFLFLVSRHTDLQLKYDKLKALKALNETELKILNRDFFQQPTGDKFRDDSHFFSEDIDLFGTGSFYQYSNRTALENGSKVLAEIFKENEIDSIEKKQKAIAELSAMTDWRQDFTATASLSKTESSVEEILVWLENYKPQIPKAMRFIPMLYSITSLILFVLFFLDIVPVEAIIWSLIIGFIFSGFFTKKITKFGTSGSKAVAVFKQYHKLIEHIEETTFKSEILVEKQRNILTKEKKASEISKAFYKLLGSLDQNSNIFYLIFGNGYFLRALATSFKAEKWIATHNNSIRTWFETIAFFDAYISLGTFAFNHPDYEYPVISSNETVIESEAVGHPLLQPDKCILNNFNIKEEQFFIVTGANMAGKSTFLRTISLQLMMANVGLPVYAKNAIYNPIKLITSMRTSDSLTDDESYFFSELKRLKFIIDEIQKDRYFIVLDEILKGTNSIDKAKGSRKFVEKLVGTNSIGIIATHDLSLCEVANESQQIENYYFDAEIINDELYFDYKFKEGICKNMNASFLLKKMKIVD